MGRILVIVHQATSDPGLVGQVLQQMGYRLDIRCLAIGHELPAAIAAYDGTIVFGGPMSANDELPFLQDEMGWIETALAANQPYLGICLGAQLLARVLGQRVSPHPAGLREIGYFPLHPTPQGQRLFHQPMMVYQWHREGFDIPPEADLLATGETFTNQAFQYGDYAFGLQFHPEITTAMIETWTTKAVDQLDLPGAQAKGLHFDRHHLYSQQVERWLRLFLHQWLRRDSELELSA